MKHGKHLKKPLTLFFSPGLLAATLATTLATNLATNLAMTLAASTARSEPGDKHDSAPKKTRNAEEKIEAVKDRLAALEQAILTANKKQDCDADSQCETLEAGSRNCGGPSRYFIISDLNPKISEVKAKAREYTAVQQQLNEIDAPLDCMPVPKEPSPTCLKNVCKAKPST